MPPMLRPSAGLTPHRYSLLICTSLLAVAAAAAPQKLVVDDNYRISPGDTLIVTVLGEKDLSGPMTVGAGGSLALPIVGSVQVVGKTLRETRDMIANTYRDVIKEPYVSVALDEGASKRRVYVGGAVEKPGSFVLPLGSTPAEAVVAAGLTEESDLTRVTYSTAGGQAGVLDLSGLRTQEPLQLDLYLGWDDRFYVPARDNRLTVVGAVVKPGSFVLPLGRTVRVLDLLTQIGGGFTENADQRSALLVRGTGGQSESLDLRRMLETGDLQQNHVLQGGDVLVVPEANRVTVAGEVVAPASFYGGSRLTLLEAVVKAGGFTAQAGLKQAKLKRHSGELCEVNLEALWRNGDLSANLTLEPGDVLLVPRAEPAEILVMGAVQRAGTVDIREDKAPTLYKMLASAGRAATADYSRVNVYRGAELRVVNVEAALEAGDSRQNLALLPGDVIYVPDVGKVALLGAFARPGLVDYDSRLTLMQYIATGGMLPPQQARVAQGVLVRTRPDGTYETVKLDLSRLKDGIVPEPVKIKPGDVIYFEPAGQKKSLWEQVREILWTVGSLSSLLD